MKNIIKIISVFVIGAFVFTSCMQEADDIYNAPDDNAESYLQFTTLNKVFAMTPADTLAFTYDFGVKVLGTPPASDLTVSLSLIENSVDLVTQVELEAMEVVIPAGAYGAFITMTINPDSFDLSPDTLNLKLSLSSSSMPAASYGSEVNFQYIYNVCDFDILNFLGGFICNEEGYGEYSVNFSLDAVEPNRIYNSNFWDWAAPGALLWYDFSGDSNQGIIIPSQPFEFGDGVVGAVEGTGTYDACTGKFSCDYIVEYGGSDYPTHHDFYRSGKNLPQIPVTKALYFK